MDGGRDHSLAIFRAAAAALVAAILVVIAGLGERQLERERAAGRIALHHPAGDAP